MKAPRGGPPPPHPPWKIRPDVARPQKSSDRDRRRVARQILGKFSAHTSKIMRKSRWQVLGTHVQNHVKISKKLTPDPSKSRPEGTKIEPRALQDAIFEKHLREKVFRASAESGPYYENTLFEPTWLSLRPKARQSRDQNVKNRC